MGNPTGVKRMSRSVPVRPSLSRYQITAKSLEHKSGTGSVGTDWRSSVNACQRSFLCLWSLHPWWTVVVVSLTSRSLILCVFFLCVQRLLLLMMRAASTEEDQPAAVCTSLTNRNVFLTVFKCHFYEDYFYCFSNKDHIMCTFIHIRVYAKHMNTFPRQHRTEQSFFTFEPKFLMFWMAHNSQMIRNPVQFKFSSGMKGNNQAGSNRNIMLCLPVFLFEM